MAKKTIEEKTIIDEFTFDDVLFDNISKNNEQILKLQMQNRALLNVYEEKEVSKGYETHNVRYYQKEGVVYFEVLKKDKCGFK